uniref:Glyco_hydr_116N domain-containing protein n=1 Tax=Mesocestoides corti TaxID=53468 RepID=A0A5K3ELY9_MESCO
MVLDVFSYAEGHNLISKYGWKKSFDAHYHKSAGPLRINRPGTFLSMLPDLSRYIADVAIPAKLQGKSVSPLDLFNPLTVKPIYGVPVGGIGCGTIGRGYKGEFCRSSLIPGRFNYDVGVADQFILTVKKNGTCLYHQVLSPPPDPVKRTNCFQSWKWSTSPGVSTFIGLYPRSWTIYNIPELKLLLICKQVSPVIPNNYKDSCLPVGAFKWTAVNFDTDADVDISITMTWRGPRAPVQSPPQNVGTAGTVCCEIGHAQNYKAEEYTIPFDDAENQLCGCLLETLIDDMPCCFGIASKSSERFF